MMREHFGVLDERISRSEFDELTAFCDLLCWYMHIFR